MSSTLVRELSIEDKPEYRSMIRMTEQDFDYLLNLVTPMIRKEDTLIRECISGRDEFSDWSIYRQHGPCTRVPGSHGPCSRAVLRKSIAQQCFFLATRAGTGRVHGCARVPGSHGPWTRPVNTAREHGSCESTLSRACIEVS